MPRSGSVDFKIPSPGHDYEPLIEALRRCREEVVRLQRECGYRTPEHHQCLATVMNVDALAKLLPGGAAERVVPGSRLQRVAAYRHSLNTLRSRTCAIP